MPKKRLLKPLSVWDQAALTDAFTAAGVKLHHIPRLYRHLIRNPGSSWHDLPELPKAAVATLDARFAPMTSRLGGAQRSADGETIKMLVQLQDGLQVEAVIMSYDTRGRGAAAAGAAAAADGSPPCSPRSQSAESGNLRATLCVSSEVGCQMGCTFCATGTMGLTADLTAGEIVEQLVHAMRIVPIRNVVYMGMGEPLNNYAAVRSAVSLMTDSRAFGLRRSAVTVSTVGVIPRLLQMADDLPGVSLALSLHAPTQELRQRIVPSARAYKLDRLMAAVDEYQQKTGQRVFFEYVMLGPDVNCTEEHAHQLGALLRGRDCTTNIIPWNPIYSPGMAFEAPAPGSVEAFQRILKEQYGVPCTIRQEKGQDVSGACGQLVLEHGGRGGSACSGGGGKLADLEDLLAAKPLSCKS